MTTGPIRPRFPTDRKIATPDGNVTQTWDYWFRNLMLQLPAPGEYTVNTGDRTIKINTNGRSLIDYRIDGSTYLDTTLHFPQLTGDISNSGLVTTLKNTGSPVSDDFVRVTTDYAGRVTATQPVSVSDITSLVDPVYVNTSGDTMTGDLSLPNIEIAGSITSVDTVQLDTSVTPGSLSPGKMKWNSTAETMDLGLPNSVTLQVGQEMYARVRNMTGSTIPNGSVVGFVGATADALLISPYLANGAFPSLYILGVMTHDIANGAFGYATVFGNVHDLNTSAFALGDVLYASPTVAGSYTNVKPTAPNNVIPVAAVTNVGTSGSIFVRPSIEQDKKYGNFTKTSTQTPAATNTAYAITFDNTVISNGVTLVSGSRITAATSGLYKFVATVQFTSSSASNKNIWCWFRKNGTNITNSALVITTSANNGYSPMTRGEFFSLNAGDYIELVFASDATTVSLAPIAVTAFAPGAPACSLNVTQVQQ